MIYKICDHLGIPSFTPYMECKNYEKLFEEKNNEPYYKSIVY